MKKSNSTIYPSYFNKEKTSTDISNIIDIAINEKSVDKLKEKITDYVLTEHIRLLNNLSKDISGGVNNAKITKQILDILEQM